MSFLCGDEAIAVNGAGMRYVTLSFLVCISFYASSMQANALFEAYPVLEQKLPYICLGEFPTPVHACAPSTFTAEMPLCRQQSLALRMSGLGGRGGGQEDCAPATLYIKQDGLTGCVQADGSRAYGGNKLRKLQYLLADALAQGARSVLTFGCAGSNHALQTAVCCKQLGLQAITLLKPQHNLQQVRHNLLLQLACGAQVLYTPDNTQRSLDVIKICEEREKIDGRAPYFIPTGGSVPRGAVGYVEAALELKQQIDAGLLPVPAKIYVSFSWCSGATGVGLLLGLKLAGIKSEVHLVLDEPEDELGVSERRLHSLFADTNSFLHGLDPAIPLCELTADDYVLRKDFAGEDYALLTHEGVAAMKALREAENIQLDGVYAGKCCAALMHDLHSGACAGQNILFWNTFCAETYTDLIKDIDYKKLPVPLQVYFETPVQPLDHPTPIHAFPLGRLRRTGLL